MLTANSTIKEFSAQRLLVRAKVATPIYLNEHKGSALRGAIFNSLRKVGCSEPQLKSCHPCTLVAACPISFLLATVDEQSRRGVDVPRPFTIQPPLATPNVFQAGDSFDFGLTLFARSVNFLPYLVVALQEMEKEGLGTKTEQGQWRRGVLRIHQICAVNPLSGEEQILFEVGKRAIEPPQLAVTTATIAALAEQLQGKTCQMRFNFLTPTRLIHEGRPLARPEFPVLVHRLIERVSSLSAEYGGETNLDFAGVMQEAQQIKLVDCRTRWEEVRGYSHRQHQNISLGGFTGEATFVGKLDKLLPLLLWGQLTHVGKDATKGNGWYTLEVKELAEI